MAACYKHAMVLKMCSLALWGQQCSIRIRTHACHMKRCRMIFDNYKDSRSWTDQVVQAKIV